VIASLLSPCYLLLEKLSKSLIVIARFSAIVSLFLLEYVPVSAISFVDEQTSSRLIGVGSL